MANVIVLIDGFNLYHALDYCSSSSTPTAYQKYKWLDLAKLARNYIYDKNDVFVKAYYFTALAHWNPVKVARHQLYIKALEETGVAVIYGEFKQRDKFCNLCRQKFQTHEEKRTDINIALTLVIQAINHTYDKAIIISGDTDLIPAIQTVQHNFPEKQIGVVIPIGKASENMKRTANFYYKMKDKHLQACLLDDPVNCADGGILQCPPTWR